MFSVGDFVVEHGGARAVTAFGVVTDIHEGEVISVRFPHGQLYSFASHCQPYGEWLDENGF